MYIADPEARLMPDGRIYVYGLRDEPETLGLLIRSFTNCKHYPLNSCNLSFHPQGLREIITIFA